MDRSPPKTPKNPEINEATPLLHDEEIVIDDELYAIGGAAGGSDEPIFETQTDIDIGVETLISARKQIRLSRPREPEHKKSVIIRITPELMGSHMHQIQLKASVGDEDSMKGDLTARITESCQQNRDEIEKVPEQDRARKTRGRRQSVNTTEFYKPKTDIDNIVETLFFAWLQFPPSRSGEPETENSELLGPRALHAMSIAWKLIKTDRDVLPEKEVIIQGLAESMVNYMYRSQLVVHDGEEEAFMAYVREIVAESWPQILDGFEEEDEQKRARRNRRKRKKEERRQSANVEELDKPQADIDNIVQILFSAWLQFPPSWPGAPEHEDSEFLGPRALQSMSTAWRQIKTERDVLPETGLIVQGLVESVVNYLYRSQLVLPDGEEAVSAHVTEIVTERWQQILDGIEEEEQERNRKVKERRQRIRGRLEKRQEVADVLWFYESFARMNLDVPMDSRIFCIQLCLCCSVFLSQVLIHIPLLAWPLSIGIMGGLYMTQCPMSDLMPYVMMAVGVAGAVAILTRLSFVIYVKRSGEEIKSMWLWILLKFFEFVFLVFLIIHLYCFFTKTPSFDPVSPEYCNETFYNFVHWINYVSIAFASTWLLVYFIKGILTWQVRKYSLRPW